MGAQFSALDAQARCMVVEERRSRVCSSHNQKPEGLHLHVRSDLKEKMSCSSRYNARVTQRESKGVGTANEQSHAGKDMVEADSARQHETKSFEILILLTPRGQSRIGDVSWTRLSRLEVEKNCQGYKIQFVFFGLL